MSESRDLQLLRDHSRHLHDDRANRECRACRKFAPSLAEYERDEARAELAAARDREKGLREAIGNLRDSLLLARSIAASGEALSDKAREQISRSLARADAALAPETHDKGRG